MDLQKSTSDKNYLRIRWAWRCNAVINDEPNEETDRNEHAMFLATQLKSHCSCFAFQLESAPTTGYLHYQGYLELINKKRKPWILKNIRAFEYLSPAKGTPQQNWTYCTKEDTRVAGPWTYGEPPAAEGREHKCEDFIKAVKAGKQDSELWNEFPTMMTVHAKALTRVRNAFHIPVVEQVPTRQQLYGDDHIEVYIFFGRPGTGKSHKARELYPNIYCPPVVTQKGGAFWLTEQGNLAPVILFEDFSGNMSLKALNQLLDPYPIMVPMKGSQVWWCPRIIIFTTNDLPGEWYDYSTRRDVQQQIFRRIDWCFDFNTPEGKALTKGVKVEALHQTYKELYQLGSVGKMIFPGPQRFAPNEYAETERFMGGYRTSFADNHVNKRSAAYSPPSPPAKKPKLTVVNVFPRKKPLVDDGAGVFPLVQRPAVEPIIIFDDGTPGDKISFDDDIINSETQPMEEIEDPDTIPKRWF